MNTVKVTYDGVTYEFPFGITLLEVSKHFQKEYDIIVGQINDDLCELDQKITKDCVINFYDLTNHLGNKVYERGLIFVFISAVREVLGCDVRIEHSIDKGIYCEFLGDVNINQSTIDAIKNKMSEYVYNKIPFTKISASRLSAIEYYKSINQLDKAESLKYEIRSSILLYRFNNLFDYFFGEMPIDASYIKYFDIAYIDPKSVVLLLPNIYLNGEIKKYEHYDKIFNAFEDYFHWCSNQNIENVYDLNKVVSDGRIDDLIYLSELHQNNCLFNVASLILNDKKIKVILIGGPSSSGKTTTSKKLKAFLRSVGLRPHTISIDDYFLERDNTPRDEQGNYDFESIKSIDIALFNNQLAQILSGEEVVLPTFNFMVGKKEYKNKLKLENNGIMIIEGLHALNEELTASIDKNSKYGIYISPLTNLNIDNHNRITTSDLRLIRRMVRDSMTRGHGASDTLDMWRSVRSGEEKYVFPYQNKCDIVINSSLIYELGVLRVYAEPLLFSVKQEDPNYNEATRLINLIRNVLPIPSTNLPYDSILREFVGNSYFSERGDE